MNPQIFNNNPTLDGNQSRFKNKLDKIFNQANEENIKKELSEFLKKEQVLRVSWKYIIFLSYRNAYRLLSTINNIQAANPEIIKIACDNFPANRHYIPKNAKHFIEKQEKMASSKTETNKPEESKSTTNEVNQQNNNDEAQEAEEKNETSSEQNLDINESPENSVVTPTPEEKDIENIQNSEGEKVVHKNTNPFNESETISKEVKTTVEEVINPVTREEFEKLFSQVSKINQSVEQIENILSPEKQQSKSTTDSKLSEEELQEKLKETDAKYKKIIELCQKTCESSSSTDQAIKDIKKNWELDINTRIGSIEKTTENKFSAIFEELSKNFYSLFQTNKEKVENEFKEHSSKIDSNIDKIITEIDSNIKKITNEPTKRFIIIQTRLEKIMIAFLASIVILILATIFVISRGM